jgi:hypothetical protein
MHANFSLMVMRPNLQKVFADWFKTAAGHACTETLKGAWSLIILMMWCLWNLRNDCIFQQCGLNYNDLVESILCETRV